MLSFAHSMGFIYDMSYLPWWKRYYYLWRFRKLGQIMKLMPRFFSLDRVMEHYGCEKESGRLYRMGDSYLFTLTCENVLDDRIDLTMAMTELRTYEADRSSKNMWPGTPHKVNLLYCPELNAFVNDEQVMRLMDFMRRKKAEYDDWCYFKTHY